MFFFFNFYNRRSTLRYLFSTVLRHGDKKIASVFRRLTSCRRGFSRIRVLSEPIREIFGAARSTAVFRLTDEGERIRAETPARGHDTPFDIGLSALYTAAQLTMSQCRAGEHNIIYVGSATNVLPIFFLPIEKTGIIIKNEFSTVT